MAALDSHTPLEKFLLFETLHPFDNESPSFPAISETLKRNTISQSRESSDGDKFKPEALQDLYLRLVKEEATLDLRSNGSGTEAGDTTIRRETPPSPQLTSVTDAIQYKGLLPRLLDRLYFQYRDHAIKSIEEEERNIKQLRKDIDETRRTEREVPTRKSSINTLLRHDAGEDRSPSRDGVSQTPLPPNGVKEPPPIASEEQAGAVPRKGVSPPTIPIVPSSGAETQPTRTEAPIQPAVAELPHIPTPPPLQQQQQTQTYPATSPKVGKSSLPSDPSRPNVVPSPSPRPNQGTYTGPERTSGSPIILPPPPGMRPSGSPPGPLDTLTDMAANRPRPTLPSPRPGQPTSQQSRPPPPPHPPQFPQPNYMQQPHQYYDGRPPYPYQPYAQNPNPQYPNHPGYPPYQLPVQGSGYVPQYPSAPPYQAPVQYPQYSTYGHTPYYPQTPRQGPFNPPSYPTSAQQTPTPAVSGKPRPPKPSPIITSASSTRYKGIDYSAFKSQPSPTRPGPDEISPISDRAPSLPPDVHDQSANQEKAASLASPKTRSRPSKRTKAPRSQPGRRGSTTSATRTRSHSLASPVAEPHPVKPEPATPAVSTAAETDTADDTSAVRKSTRARRNTLRSLEAAEEPTRPVPTMKRKRANTNEDTSITPSAAIANISPPSSSASLTPATPAPISALGAEGAAGNAESMQTRSGYILGTRNLPRTSQTLMNDISSHKQASLFARPLTEREAPGYKDLIYRPQDLKSIKSAIVAGSRALGLATSSSTGIESSSGASVSVPASADVIPPRGIVNSSQLEKELMRVFANAVMFNPDPQRGLGPVLMPPLKNKKAAKARHVPSELAEEAQLQDEVEAEQEGVADKGEEDEGSDDEGGVVADAREMFEAVDAAVAQWRQAERAVEDWGGGGGGVGGGGGSGSGNGGGGNSLGKAREPDETDELAADTAKEEATSTGEQASPSRTAVGKRRKR